MSGLYGAWLDEGHDYTDVKDRVDTLHSEFYEKYENRVDAINACADIFIETYEILYPKLKLKISYPNLLLLVGRYFNDIVHYKVWHEITDTELAKMCSHMAKWAQINQPVFTDVDREAYDLLNQEEKSIALNINLYFIDQVIKYLLLKYAPNSVDSVNYKKIFYFLKTGQYDAKSMTLYFEDL